MAFIIDERLAGGRPQKLTTPVMPDISLVASRVPTVLRLSRISHRPQRTRRILAWARA